MSPDSRERMDGLIRSLEARLSRPKPGLAAQVRMIPHPRPGHRVYQEVEDTCHKAGVLLLLYPKGGRPHLVFTLRTEQVDFHKGQISFPGGHQEPDERLDQTALREAQEELGIPPESVRILGSLTPLYIPPSNTCIYPVVGVTEEPPRFIPHEPEVAEVLEIPLDHLIHPESIQRETRTLSGQKLEVPFYHYKGHKIWGATAMVLAELLSLLKSART
ncbi:MAG: NUDIX hydrolase [Candidatus Aminicenantales bacterium]